MSLSGYQLAADLSELKMIGAVDLPQLEHTYFTLNRAVANTADRDEVAFQQPDGGMCQVRGPWSSLRDDLALVLGMVANNLDTAGAVMLHIVEAYAASDAAAATSLEQAWRNGPPIVDPAERPPAPAPRVVHHDH